MPAKRLPDVLDLLAGQPARFITRVEALALVHVTYPRHAYVDSFPFRRRKLGSTSSG